MPFLLSKSIISILFSGNSHNVRDAMFTYRLEVLDHTRSANHSKFLGHFMLLEIAEVFVAMYVDNFKILASLINDDDHDALSFKNFNKR